MVFLRSSPIFLHGFGVRYDLPIPLSFYLVGASSVVALSFILIAYFVRGGAEDLRYPRFRIDNLRGIGPLVRGPVPRLVGGVIGVSVLLATIITGFFGSTDATSNPAEYLLWIYGWPFLVMLSTFVGNVYALVNPWAGLYGAFRFLSGGRPVRPLLGGVSRLGLWPAAGAYLLFALFELGSGQSAHPRSVALALSIYTVYTLAMMVIFGREWLDHGEAISVLYKFIGAFGPVEVEQDAAGRRVYLRPWAIGLTRLSIVSWDVVVFVVLMLASLAFDGLESTPLWATIYNATGPVQDAIGDAGPPLVKLLGLLGVSLVFGAVYLLFMKLVSAFARTETEMRRASSLFAFTLVPIALVYFAAHFYSYVVIQSQGIVPLLADPLHTGAQFLPASIAAYKPSFALADPGFVWYLQVALIVLGHILAVYLAHARALAIYPTHHIARKSQYPMLLLMILYTSMSLWIIAQPNVEVG
jgi:hypothetical protein